MGAMPNPKKRVLVADDQPAVLAALSEYLESSGYVPLPCKDGGEALAIIRTTPPELVVIDASMPVLSGMDVVRHIRFLCGNHSLPVLVITGRTDPDIQEAALRAGAHRVLTKPFRLADLAAELKALESLDATPPERLDSTLDFESALLRAIPSLSTGNGALLPFRRTIVESLTLLVHATDAQDPHGPYHSLHVAEISQLLALTLDLDRSLLPRVRLAGLLHDVGKLTFPPDLLSGERSRTEADAPVIGEHPVAGSRLLEALDPELAGVIRSHHEWFDGSGYPDGLAGEAIPLIARILCVADAYSAMTMRSGYAPRLAPAEALGQLEKGSGTQFDPGVVAALRHLLTEPAPCLGL